MGNLSQRDRWRLPELWSYCCFFRKGRKKAWQRESGYAIIMFAWNKVWWGYSAVGSALEWHSRGQGFESPYLHSWRDCDKSRLDSWRQLDRRLLLCFLWRNILQLNSISMRENDTFCERIWHEIWHEIIYLLPFFEPMTASCRRRGRLFFFLRILDISIHVPYNISKLTREG